MSRRKKKSAQGNATKFALSPNSVRAVAIAMYDYHLAEDNGKHGLIGLFDTLGAKQFPARFVFYLFVKLAGPPGAHAARVELREKTSGRRILDPLTFNFQIPAQLVAYHDFITQITFDFPGPGVLEWQVYVDNVLGGSYAFQVVPAQ